MRSIKPTTIRLSDEDIEMVETIKKRYGVSSLIAVIRLALRIAADKEVPPPGIEPRHPL